MDKATFANAQVLEFYKKLPFNYRDSVGEQAKAIVTRDAAEAYPPLLPLLKKGASVLDVGCGSGWLANMIAHHHKCEVLGLDFNPVAIERARAVAEALGLPARFLEADLFAYVPERPADVVISLGVLHHTDDCREGVRSLCRNMLRPGGHLFVGLYHVYGRKPFLDHFRRLKESGASEQELFRRYRRLHSGMDDETLLMSWFRDQVLHPKETQHTLREMVEVLEGEGLRLVASSINRFQPFGDTVELFAREADYERLGREMLDQGRYFPGFFVFLARKQGPGGAA